MRVWTNRLGLACLIKQRKQAVKLGGFTALTLPTEGGRNSIERWPEERALWPAWPSDRSMLGHAHAAGKILADPMGHERTGEPDH